MNTKTIDLTFSIEGKWLMDTARRMYWFEDNETFGKKLIKDGLIGITDEQVKSIIDGDAILKGWARKNEHILFVKIEDKKFKKEIINRRLWLNENYYKIGEFHVNKKLIDQYIERYFYCQSAIQRYDDYQDDQLDLFRNSIWVGSGYKIPSVDYIPEKDSANYRFTKTINNFLREIESRIRNSDPLDVVKVTEQITNEIKVIKEELKSKIKKLNYSRQEGCVLFIIPDPENKKKKKYYNVDKGLILTFIDERNRGERAMKFTLSMDLDKEKTLKRYQALNKNIAYAHKKLMESLNLWHSESGYYRKDQDEFYIDQLVTWYAYQVIFHSGKKSLTKMPHTLEFKFKNAKPLIVKDGVIVDDDYDYV